MDLNRHLSKEMYKCTINMKRHLPSLVIKEIQIKTTNKVTFHTRQDAYNQRQIITNVDSHVEKWEPSYILLIGTKKASTMEKFGSSLKSQLLPQLVWLTGLGVILQTEKSLVRLQVRAHAWAVGQVPPSPSPARGVREATETYISLTH